MRAQSVNTVSPASNNFNPWAWLHLEEDEEEEREAAVSANKAGRRRFSAATGSGGRVSL